MTEPPTANPGFAKSLPRGVGKVGGEDGPNEIVNNQGAIGVYQFYFYNGVSPCRPEAGTQRVATLERLGDREDAAAEQDREDGWPSFLVIYCIYHLHLKPLPGPYITSPPPGRVGWSQLLSEV
ncbi:hypothetical protein MGG_16664 [Pyricularia oryzae 70-15]|uniref:Uncharacterized protein n=1 Tax=Pyricularia oryzae (strain 70-15 / ATCC MYA-4617 / FGSC 8958) TaxID=242507 RepID=G4N2J2_PYRO7|nr:uncharacterized protein MGG_16664 [Pyricularia oryzae 70-15]EHA51701.1 hypothetical protein MGG_16664 [Pyricularia oryzae 70-15]